MRRGTEQRALLDLLKGVEAKSQTHTPHRFLRRGRDGVEVLLDTLKVCEVRGDLGTQRQGAVSLAPTSSLARGVTGLPSVVTVQGGVLRLEAHTPPLLTRGETQEVTLTGVGLPPGLRFDYLDPSQEEGGTPEGGEGVALRHPHVHIQSTKRLSPFTYRLVVEVDPEAPLTTDAPIAFGRAVDTDPDSPQSPLEHRAERMYGIAPPSAPTAFLAYAFDGAELTAGRYAADGTPLATLGRDSRSSWDPLWASPIWNSPHVAPGSLAIADGYRVEVVEWGEGTHTTTDFEGEAVSAAYVAGHLHWVTLESGSGSSLECRLYRALPTLDEGSVELLITGHHVAANEGWGPAAWVGWLQDRVHVARRYTSPSGEKATVATLDFTFGPSVDPTPLHEVGTGWPSSLGSLRHDQYLITGGEDGAVWGHWPPPSWPISEGVSVEGGPSPSGATACLVSGGRLLSGAVSSTADPEIDVPFGESPDWPTPDLIFPTEGAL